MLVWKEGGCHCGAIRIRVRDSFARALHCNCSVCFKKGFIHLIVEPQHFQLLQGEEARTVYAFNTGVARHYFCRICGISPYYVPRSHPDAFDVNLRCLDDLDWAGIRMETFDGKNWEANIKNIEGFS